MLILLLRVKDWLHGVCQTAPVKDAQGRLNPASLTEAERLRIIHLLITNPCSEGGAGVTPNEGDWPEVDAIFPLHDHNFNKEWLKHWSTRPFLSIEELTKIRDHYGEKVRLPDICRIGRAYDILIRDEDRVLFRVSPVLF